MKNLMLALALFSFTNLAHAERALHSEMWKTYSFRLAKDVEFNGCTMRAGSELNVWEDDFGKAKSEAVNEVKYGYHAASVFKDGCWSHNGEMPTAKYADIYAEADRDFSIERANKKQDYEALVNRRTHQPLILNEGDLISLNTTWAMQPKRPIVEHFWENNVAMIKSASCELQGGGARVVKAPKPGSGGEFELILTESSDGDKGCQKGAMIRVTENKVKEWFNLRLENAVPIAKDGKCYRESKKSFADCDYRKMDAGYQVNKLAEVCPQLSKLYDLKGISKVENKDLEDAYPGAEIIANNSRMSIDWVKYCEKKLEPEKEYQQCVAAMEVPCKGMTRKYGVKQPEDFNEWERPVQGELYPYKRPENIPAESTERVNGTLEP
jgi:hypothetical protein